MDKQGNIWTPEEVQQRLGELTGAEDVPQKHSPDEQYVSEDEPRKMTLSEYLSSPQFQRQRKIESERAQRSETFERKMAFRSAQEQNPIKGRPRRKRGRKGR